MPSFEVEGLSSKGRRVKRTYRAETEAGARRKAVADGVTIENLVVLSPEPATERQLAYAQSLGIQLPASPTLEQMSDLISRAVEAPASEWLVERARYLGADLSPTRFLSLEYVSRQVHEVVPPGSQAALVELAFWYVQSVLRHRRGAEWPSPGKSGVSPEIVFELASRLVADSRALKSLRREYPDVPVYEFIEFGDGWGGTHSTRTNVFALASELLLRAGLL